MLVSSSCCPFLVSEYLLFLSMLSRPLFLRSLRTG